MSKFKHDVEECRNEAKFLEETLVEAWQRCVVASRDMNDKAANEIRMYGFPVVLKYLLEKRSNGKA